MTKEELNREQIHKAYEQYIQDLLGQRQEFAGNTSDNPPEGVFQNLAFRASEVIDGTWIENGYGIGQIGIDAILDRLTEENPNRVMTNGHILEVLEAEIASRGQQG